MVPIVLVHGYKYDPSKPGENNPHDTIYKDWGYQLEDYDTVEFAWNSAGGGWRAVLRAWAAGYRNTYRWAYSKLALDASWDLYNDLAFVQHVNFKSDILCHSLGSRVALKAIAYGAPVRNCIILNGAEMVSKAENIVRNRPEVNFYNVFAKTDAVVDFLAENLTPDRGDAIGQAGLAGYDNWTNIVLDDSEVKAWALKAHGWTLRGDGAGIGDHTVSYEWDGNWPLYRAILSNKPLRNLPDVVKKEST